VPATPAPVPDRPGFRPYHLARHARHFRREGGEAGPPSVLMASLSCRISPRTVDGIFLDKSRSPRRSSHRRCCAPAPSGWTPSSSRTRSGPSTRRSRRRTCPDRPAFLRPHFARHARHFEVKTLSCLDHRVHDIGGAEEFALQRARIDVETHGCSRSPAPPRRPRGSPRSSAREGRRSVVDGRFHFAQAAGLQTDPDALTGLAFLTDDFADAFELLRHALVGRHDIR